MRTCIDCSNFPESRNKQDEYICRKRQIPRGKESHICSEFREKEKREEIANAC